MLSCLAPKVASARASIKLTFVYSTRLKLLTCDLSVKNKSGGKTIFAPSVPAAELYSISCVSLTNFGCIFSSCHPVL